MSKKSEPKTFNEAIEHLEGASYDKIDEFKKIIEDLKPHLDELKDKVETHVKKAKGEVEDKVKENPWAVFAFVGILAFIIGCIIGSRRRDDNQ